MRSKFCKLSGLLAVVLLLPIMAFGQCFPDNYTFTAGESARYDVFYNWGFIWVDAGRVSFSVNKKVFNNKPSWYLESIGHSLQKHDWIYKVRDTFRCHLDFQTHMPLYFEQHTREGSYRVHNKYWYNYDKQQIYTRINTSKAPLTQDTVALPPCAFDVLSAVYYARNLDFSKTSEGKKIPIRIIIDGKVNDLYIRYIGRQVIETKAGDSYRCIVFKPLLVEGTIFEGGEEMTVYVTDDENKVPVLIEAEILVGKVKAFLSGYQNLRHPMSALLPRD